MCNVGFVFKRANFLKQAESKTAQTKNETNVERQAIRLYFC